MTDERLYIDGVLVDIGTDTKITLDVKSNLFRDISKIVSNNTYTVKLPKTVRNQMILEHTDLVQSDGDYPYLFHQARYFRNGVEVIKDGRATILAVTDEAIEVCIVWGLYPNFSTLVSEGATLNQMESEDRILWTGKESADDYAAAVEKPYFYADMNFWAEDVIDIYWTIGNSAGVYKTNGDLGSAPIPSTGTTTGGSRNKYLHPSVKVSYVLELIRKSKGVTFEFTDEAKDYIDTLIIPLINKKANELTFKEGFAATLPAINGKTLGELRPTITASSNVFSEGSGTVDGLTAIASTKLKFYIKCTATYDLSNWKYKDGRNWNFYGVFVLMKLTKADGSVERYTAGQPGGYMKVAFADCPTGQFIDTMTGEGVIEMEAGDKLTFGVRYVWPVTNNQGAINYEVTTREGNPMVSFNGGTIAITATGKDDSVPAGGYFPIAYNLPNIKIIDFVKFLAAITGTFPLQMAKDGVVTFVPLSTIWGNTNKAVDWTRRVIAQGAENKPKNIDFGVTDYAQHNYYKWKEDDTVTGDYDGDLQISNKTLDKSREVMTFPFAGTDGNRIPIYTKGDSTTNSDGSTVEGEPQYKACKDRILRLVEGSNGKAAGVFDINMQTILNTKYAELINTLQSAKVVKETMRVRDIDLLEFDETKPVYLAQYGASFAVMEIKSESNGLAEVEMLKLNF